MPMTPRELGKATGFSVATFSRRLNSRSHLVANEARQQIIATAKEHGCQPNLAGRSLCSVRTNTIGLNVYKII
jgi:DNA-binding LacI/PurR family transcriptional regulator